MPSFRQISAHFPALVVDAASTQIQVGVLQRDGTSRWRTSLDEAGVAVFAELEKLQVDLRQMSAFVFCHGPGSVLGIRTAAMAMRTWCVLQSRPVFAYCSLGLVAHALGREDVGVIADARRDSWHHYQIGHGLRRVAAADLSGELVMPDNFRHWSALPANVKSVPYSISEMLQKIWDADVLTETDAPDAFLHEEPNYVLWTPKIHRTPGTV